eukprot:gb/GECH01010639.1/.p1 GENE.gb/GECH01010639.1/~~gb/GECH01010639.1/.p1  ORF type:complete len:107 (+),score=18.55 gb/GECH01010639.1/:1-321(+)
MKYLSSSLKHNDTLQSLDLWNNDIDDQGAYHLSQLLRKNTVLNYLDLSYNNVGNQGALYLGHALPYNHSLVGLSLYGILFLGSKYNMFKNVELNSSMQEMKSAMKE